MAARRHNLDMKSIIAEYRRGDSLPIVARRHGVNTETIRRRLMQAEVPIRDRREGQISRFHGSGDLAGLALDLGLPVDEITALLIRHGVIPEPEPDWANEMDQAMVQIFVQKYAEGLSCKQISDDARASGWLFKPAYIADCLRDAGVTLRTGRKKKPAGEE